MTIRASSVRFAWLSISYTRRAVATTSDSRFNARTGQSTAAGSEDDVCMDGTGSVSTTPVKTGAVGLRMHVVTAALETHQPPPSCLEDGDFVFEPRQRVLHTMPIRVVSGFHDALILPRRRFPTLRRAAHFIGTNAIGANERGNEQRRLHLDSHSSLEATGGMASSVLTERVGPGDVTSTATGSAFESCARFQTERHPHDDEGCRSCVT
jgi:hypothetical protein